MDFEVCKVKYLVIGFTVGVIMVLVLAWDKIIYL